MIFKILNNTNLKTYIYEVLVFIVVINRHLFRQKYVKNVHKNVY